MRKYTHKPAGDWSVFRASFSTAIYDRIYTQLERSQCPANYKASDVDEHEVTRNGPLTSQYGLGRSHLLPQRSCPFFQWHSLMLDPSRERMIVEALKIDEWRCSNSKFTQWPEFRLPSAGVSTQIKSSTSCSVLIALHTVRGHDRIPFTLGSSF